MIIFFQSVLIALFVVLASMEVNATDSLTCNGSEFEVLFHVGHNDGDIVSDLTIYDNINNAMLHKIIDFDFGCISWPEYRLNSHENNLAVMATTHEFEVIEVYIAGNNGKLFINNKQYALTCDWFR